MISLKYYQIPAFLHGGAFYLSLNGDASDNESEVIQIPKRCFKENDEVSNLEDFGQLLHTMQFWGVDVIPDGMIEFLHGFAFSHWQPIASEVLDAHSSLLKDLLSIYKPFHFLEDFRVVWTTRVRLVIQRNRSELLAFWLEKGWFIEQHLKFPMGTRATELVAECGSLECLQILIKHNFQVTQRTVKLSACKGHLECLRFLRDNNFQAWDSSVLINAASGGHLDVLEYAHQQGLEWVSQVAWCAARHGHLHCLRYAHEHGCSWTDGVTSIAAAGGHLDCLRYALEQGCDVQIIASIHAAERDRLNCLQLLEQYNAPWNGLVAAAAARFGHLQILQYLHEHHCPWDTRVYDEAVRNEKLDCIQYAHSQGLALPTEEPNLCKSAAVHGHLDVLKYLHENGAMWNESIVYEVVMRKKLEIVQYAISQGCDWNRHECTLAAENRYSENQHILQYLLSQWTPSQDQMHIYAMYAAQCHNDSLLRYLVEEQHYSLRDNRVFSTALACGSLACVQYCFEKGCREVDYDTLCKIYCSGLYFRASDRKLLECIQYLVEQGWEVLDPFMQFVQRFADELPNCEACCNISVKTIKQRSVSDDCEHSCKRAPADLLGSC